MNLNSYLLSISFLMNFKIVNYIIIALKSKIPIIESISIITNLIFNPYKFAQQ